MTGADRWDVIVVGARIAGAATALRLARQGLRVLAVERGQHRTDTLSTHALMRGGAAMLQSLGLLDRIVAAGTPAVRQTRFHYPGETRTVSIRPAAGVDAPTVRCCPTTVPPGWGPRCSSRRRTRPTRARC
jgi:2-polyprenyl-6-methoxyphenol hydroxylase-like FAD-dependent oxidoreductase